MEAKPSIRRRYIYFLNAAGGLQTAKRVIQTQLTDDGYRVDKITTTEAGELDIIAELEANE